MNNLNTLPQRKRGGSRLGWSFVSSWSKCQTLWYLENLYPWVNHNNQLLEGIGIEKQVTDAALDIGTRFHDAVEAWYRSGWITGVDDGTRDLDTALAAHRRFDTELVEIMDPKVADNIATADQCMRMYHELYGVVAPDYPAVEIITINSEPAIEYELEIPVGYGDYVFTARLDTIYKLDGYLWSMEHKTTSATALGGLLNRIHIDGQFTGQYWLLSHHFPDEPIGGVTCDYVVKDRGKRSDKPALGRVNTSRTPEQLEKFRLDIARKLDHIDNAVGNYRRLLENDVAPLDAANIVFDGSPDGYQCVSLTGKCKFYELCTNRDRAGEFIHQQFKPREWKHESSNPFTESLSAKLPDAVVSLDTMAAKIGPLV